MGHGTSNGTGRNQLLECLSAALPTLVPITINGQSKTVVLDANGQRTDIVDGHPDQAEVKSVSPLVTAELPDLVTTS